MLDPPEPLRPEAEAVANQQHHRAEPAAAAAAFDGFAVGDRVRLQGISGLCQLHGNVGRITNANYRGMDPAARFAVVLEEGPVRLAVAEGRQLRKQVATALLVPLPQQAPAAALACSRRRSERGYLYRDPISLSDTEPCSGATGS